MEDTNKMIKQLEKYMIKKENLNLIKKKIPPHNLPLFEKHKNIETKPLIEKENKVSNFFPFIPKLKDSLFWCFFIIENGHETFELLNEINIVKEKQEKINYLLELRKNKDILKSYKIRPFAFLENELSNEDKTTLKTFLGLCLIHKKNVIIINKKSYYEMVCNAQDKKINVVEYFNSFNKYGIVDLDEKQIMDIKDKYYKFDTFDMKLKSINSYTLSDLLEIKNKLNYNPILNEKKKTKKEIYEEIILFL
jgi:hypothetical protein